MGLKQKLMSWFTGFFGGEYITKKGVDRQLLFIFFCFILISLYLVWGLWVEDRMAQINRNEKVIEELKIEIHEKDLRLISSGNTALHAPLDPPRRIVIE